MIRDHIDIFATWGRRKHVFLVRKTAESGAGKFVSDGEQIIVAHIVADHIRHQKGTNSSP